MNIKIPKNIVKDVKYFYKDKKIKYRNLSIKDFYKKPELTNLQKLIEFNINTEFYGISVRKNIILDININFYKAGEHTCFIKDWHLDGKGYKGESFFCSENIYYIFCIGAPTEYIDINNIKFPALKSSAFHSLNTKLIKTITEESWFKYGERLYHRGPLIKQDLHRIWIRITYSDYIKTKKNAD